MNYLVTGCSQRGEGLEICRVLLERDIPYMV